MADGSFADSFGPDDFAELPPGLELWAEALDDIVSEEAADDFCEAPVEDVVDPDRTDVEALERLPRDCVLLVAGEHAGQCVSEDLTVENLDESVLDALGVEEGVALELPEPGPEDV